MRTTTRKTALVAATLMLLTGLAPATALSQPAAPAAASSAAATCGITWGSLPKARADAHLGNGQVNAVRSGRHACFDRVVVDLGQVSASDVGYDVRYVDVVTAPGSGQEVPLAGGAALQIEVTVPAYTPQGVPTYTLCNPAQAVDVTGYDTLRQVAFLGSFEGQTSLGLGVRARLPFQVFTLDGPGSGSRLVIDVAHRW